MSTFAEKIISFYRDLDFDESLPEGISVMNPFRNNAGGLAAAEALTFHNAIQIKR